MSEKKEKPVKNQEKEPHKIILLLAPIALLIASFFLVRTAMDKVVANAMDAFKASEDEMTSTTYENASEIYKVMADEGHPANKRTITMGALKQAEKLEVYRIPVTEFITETKENNAYGITEWIRMDATAIYNVNLSLSDYIIDAERDIVTVIIPRFELEYDFGEGDENIEKLLFRQEGELPVDTDLSEAQTSVDEKIARLARSKIRDKIKNSQEYHDSAKKAAEQIAAAMIQSLNPEHDLHVIVEFADEEEDS